MALKYGRVHFGTYKVSLSLFLLRYTPRKSWKIWRKYFISLHLCCLEHLRMDGNRGMWHVVAKRCQVAFWIGPQLVITSDKPAVSKITFCVRDITASLVIFLSIKKYRLCNKRHTWQIDSVPHLCGRAPIQPVVTTQTCLCSAEWVHLQYFTEIRASQKYAANSFCNKLSHVSIAIYKNTEQWKK